MLPPTHKNFPAVSLIHGICAVACLVSDDKDPVHLQLQDYWRSESSPMLYHLKWAKVHVDDAVSRGGALFQVAQVRDRARSSYFARRAPAQAVILICFCSYSQGRWVEGAFAFSSPQSV
jgi:hypothetical protein